MKNVQISGIGGIETWRDAVEFLLLGCRNVQVTTAIMQYGYRIVEDMISGVSHFMDERGYDKLDDFIGLALGNVIPAEELNRDFKIIPNIDHKKCIGCGRCYVSCYDGAHQAIDWDAQKRRANRQRRVRRLPSLPERMPCTGMHHSRRNQVEGRQEAGRNRR